MRIAIDKAVVGGNFILTPALAFFTADPSYPNAKWVFSIIFWDRSLDLVYGEAP